MAGSADSAPSVAPSVASGASPTTPPAAASTSSASVQVSGNAGSKVQAGAVIAGVALLAAFAL